MNSAKVELRLWMSEWPGGAQAGAMVIEEPIEEGESLRRLLNRLAERVPQLRETIFDPLTQSISSEMALVINDRVENPFQGLETLLKDGDRILFFPYLAGG